MNDEPVILEPAKEPAKKSVAKSAPADTVFISAERESHMFSVCGVSAIRDPSGNKLMWEVPADKVEAFSRHHHVVTNRIVKAK